MSSSTVVRITLSGSLGLDSFNDAFQIASSPRHFLVNVPLTVSVPCFNVRGEHSVRRNGLLQLGSVNSDYNAYESSDNDRSSSKQQGMTGTGKNLWGLSTNETVKRLKRYGISGILSYGLLNTCYYLSTFLVVWFYVTPAPGRMGYFAAAERFLKVMAMVWAGSQVTKLVRAGGALALAPFVDRGLSWFTVKFNLGSQGKAFMVIAGFCFGLAFTLFLIVTLLWA